MRQVPARIWIYLMASFLSNEYATLNLYFSRLLWLYRSSYRINKSKFFRLFVLSILGIVFQILFFFGFIFYINNDQILIHSFFLYEFDRSLPEIITLSAFFLVIFFVGAFSQYRSEALSLDISFSYEKHIKKFFLSDIKNIEGLHFFAKKYGISTLKIFNADTRAACRVLRVSSNLLIPIILLFFGSLGLIIYFPLLSSIFVLLALFFIFFQKNISREVSISSRNLEAEVVTFTKLAREALSAADNETNDQKKGNLNSRYLESESFRKFYRDSEGRILGQFKAVFLSNIFFMLALTISALYFYGLWLSGFNFDLGDLISLVVFARVFLGSVKIVSSRLAVISRFHHSFSRHVEVAASVCDPRRQELNTVSGVLSKKDPQVLCDASIDENEDEEI